MLSFQEILSFYPEHLKSYPRFILREYLQHKILQIVFDSPLSNKFSFLGGTCLRIIHGNQRFSEDLDFDNFAISIQEFEQLGELIKVRLESEGLSIEIKSIQKGAYHCYIRFPELLFLNELSGHKEEKILIQIDSEAQDFKFTPEKFLLNKFDVFSEILVTPVDILLSQKFYTILNRKRNKGRDFFDVVFLISKTSPNYTFLNQKLGIQDAKELKNMLIERCSNLDMNEMAKDVEPFLFRASDSIKVSKFISVIEASDNL